MHETNIDGCITLVDTGFVVFSNAVRLKRIQAGSRQNGKGSFWPFFEMSLTDYRVNFCTDVINGNEKINAFLPFRNQS